MKTLFMRFQREKGTTSKKNQNSSHSLFIPENKLLVLLLFYSSTVK